MLVIIKIKSKTQTLTSGAPAGWGAAQPLDQDHQVVGTQPILGAPPPRALERRPWEDSLRFPRACSQLCLPADRGR